MKDLKEDLKLFPELFFDLLGYLLPGYLLFILFSHSKNFLFIDLIKSFTSVEIIIIDILMGYVVGHLLTTLSSIILVKPLNLFLGNPIHYLIGVEEPLIKTFAPKLEASFQQGLIEKIRNKFNRELDTHSFFLCENYVRNINKELGFIIRKRHAFEHLFRNLFISEIFLIFLFDFDKKSCWILAIVLLITFLRYFDFRFSWPKVVYENFYIMQDETTNHQNTE